MKTIIRKLVLFLTIILAMHVRAGYDPTFQRWITFDPIGERGGLNLYGFVGNNPVNRIDPLGLAWYDWFNPLNYSSGFANWQGQLASDAQAKANGYKDSADMMDQLNDARRNPDIYLHQKLTLDSLNTAENITADAAKAYLTAATSVTPAGAGAKCVSLTFKTGHVAEHLKDIGLPAQEVEAAIASEIKSVTQGASQTGSFWGRVTVDGKVIEYRAFTLPDGTINVGTYYPPK